MTDNLNKIDKLMSMLDKFSDEKIAKHKLTSLLDNEILTKEELLSVLGDEDTIKSLMEDDTMSKEDFVKSFEQVINLVLEIKQGNEETALSIKEEQENLHSLVDDSVEKIQKENKKILNLSASALGNLKKVLNKSINDRIKELRGKDGEDADEEKIIERLAKLIPDIPEPIKLLTPNETIETINKAENKIDIERVEGLDEVLRKKVQGVQSGGVVSGRELIKEIDISGDLDGSTKTFNIAVVWNIIMVHGSSFPYALRKDIDWTWTPTSITFTSEINASTSLASGQTVILMVVSG